MKFCAPAIVLIVALFISQGCNNSSNLGKGLSYKQSVAVKTRKGRTTNQWYEHIIDSGVRSYNLMELSRGLGSKLAMYELTDSIKYIDSAFAFTLKILSKAKNSSNIEGNRSDFNDHYRSWININPNYKKIRRGGGHLKEIPLYESYFLRYVAKMLYLAYENDLPQKSGFVAQYYGEVLNFVEVHGWQKWHKRGGKCYRYLFRSRTHMTSHWALVALFMSEIGVIPEQKEHYQEFLEMYNAQLRDNLSITRGEAYKWNMTWDSPWPWGLRCKSIDTSIVQDASHGNHVITYVIESFSLDKEWTQDDISRFVNTTKRLLYSKKKNCFLEDLDGNYSSNMSDGIEYSDGFLKLARYDKELLKMFEKARLNSNNSYDFKYSEIQYVAEFKLAQKYLSH